MSATETGNKVEVVEPLSAEDSPTDGSQSQPTSSIADVGGTLSRLRRGLQFAKQSVLEMVGKATHTENAAVEAKIDKLQAIFDQYNDLLRLTKQFRQQSALLAATQRSIGDHFVDCGIREENILHEPLKLAGEAHQAASKEAGTMIPKVDRFIDSISTFRNSALEDARLSVQKYEMARIAFDAARNNLDALVPEGTTPKKPNPKVEAAQMEVKETQEAFEKLGKDLFEKIIVLNEMRIQTLKNQLNDYMIGVSEFYTEIGRMFGETMTKINDHYDKVETTDSERMVRTEDFRKHVLNEETATGATSSSSSEHK